MLSMGSLSAMVAARGLLGAPSAAASSWGLRGSAEGSESQGSSVLSEKGRPSWVLCKQPPRLCCKPPACSSLPGPQDTPRST